MLQRMLLGSVMTLLLFGLGKGRATAQDYPQQVKDYLARSTTLKNLQNYNFAPVSNGIKTGYIANGDGHFQDAVYHLERGYAYALVGQCDEDCRQLSFELFDPDGNKIGSNETSGDEPAVWLLAMKSGDYRVRARIPTCRGLFGCYWGVELVGK